MKILHMPLNYHPSTGGLQTLFREVSRTLVSQYGDEVRVWTVDALTNPAQPSARPAGPKHETLDGVRIRRFPYARRVQRTLQRGCAVATQVGLLPAEVFPHLRHGPIAFRMGLALLAARPDVICVGPAGYLHVLSPERAAAVTRVPVVLVGALHLPPDETIPPSIIRTIARADAYIALTPHEADVVIRHGIEEAKIFIAGPGIELRTEPSDVEAARTALGFAPGPLVAFIGRQAVYKGIITLIDAMEEVWANTPHARLVIAGPVTRHAPAIRARVAQLDPPRREHVTVWEEVDTDTKRHLFTASDVVVNVSTEESFGIVVLEAWAAGTPIVAADIGATRAVISSGVDGILVPPRDATALGAALCRVLDDLDYRTQLAANGRQAVRRHTWVRTAETWRSAYRFAASARRSEPVEARGL